MDNNSKKEEAYFYIEAQRKVSQLRWFYVHLVGYLVVLGLIIWNLIIIEDTKYTNAILAINYSTIIIWGFFVTLNGIKVYKGHSIFSKKWEEKKMKAFLGDNHKTWD